MNEDTKRVEKLKPFIEELGLIFDGYGLPRMAGRVLGWLLVSNPPHQSAGQLAEVLQASKGSISSATKMLTQIALVERISLPGDRKTYYVIKPDVWVQLSDTGAKARKSFISVAEQGIALLEGEPRENQVRLEEMRHVHVFFEQERVEQVERWKKAWELWKEDNLIKDQA